MGTYLTDAKTKGGSKAKEKYIAESNQPKEDKKEDKKEEKKEWIVKKKHWIKKKTKNLDKVIAKELSKDTLFAGGGAVKGNRGMGVALRGGGRAFLKGGKV